MGASYSSGLTEVPIFMVPCSFYSGGVIYLQCARICTRMYVYMCACMHACMYACACMYVSR